MPPQLRRILGYSANTPNTLLMHPNCEKAVYTAGRTVVISSLTDPEDQTVLRGHAAAVSYMSIGPTGKYLITGEAGTDSDVCIWDLASEQLVTRFSEHDLGVSSCSFSKDGLFYCSHGAVDTFVYICETSSGDIVCKRRIDDQTYRKVLFGSRIRDERGHNLAKYNLMAVSESGNVVSFVFNPRDNTLAPTTLATGPLRRIVKDCAYCSRDRALLVASTNSSDVLVIDAVRNTFLTSVTLPNTMGPLDCIAVFPSPELDTAQLPVYTTYERIAAFDERIAVGGAGSVAILRGQGATWEVEAIIGLGKNIDGTDQKVVNISADEQGRVLTGLSSGAIVLLTPDKQTGKFTVVPISENHTVPCTGMAFVGSSEGTILATASRDHTVRIWDLVDYFPGITIGTQHQVPSALCINDIQIIVGFESGDMNVYDIENGDLLMTLAGADRTFVSALAASSTNILVGGKGGDVRIWDLRARRLLSTCREHTLTVSGVSLSGDGSVISSSEDRFLIATKNGSRVADVYCEGPLRGLSMIGDLSVVACGRSVALVNLPQRKVLQTLQLETKAMSVCSNAANIFCGGEDGSVFVLDHQLKMLYALPAHAKNSSVTIVACTNSWLCTSDQDGITMLWTL